MKCFECDKTVQINKYRAFMYSGVGLDNICLLNQRVEVCSGCDTETPLLRQAGKLHRHIGVAIALQPRILSGPEMRFLRRSAGYKAIEMAHRLRVNEATYSKWENGKNALSSNADKIVRLSYLTALERLHPEYSTHVATVVEMDVSNTSGYIIALNADDLDKPARYLPETHELFEEPDTTIVHGHFITFEKTALDTITGVASLIDVAPCPRQGDLTNVCISVPA